MGYIQVFIVTNCLELPIYAWGLKRLQAPWKSCLLFTIFNSVTHPLVFFWMMRWPFSYLTNVMIAEAFAVVAEATLLKIFFAKSNSLSWMRAFSLSLTANLVSWQLAAVINYFTLS